MRNEQLFEKMHLFHARKISVCKDKVLDPYLNKKKYDDFESSPNDQKIKQIKNSEIEFQKSISNIQRTIKLKFSTYIDALKKPKNCEVNIASFSTPEVLQQKALEDDFAKFLGEIVFTAFGELVFLHSVTSKRIAYPTALDMDNDWHIRNEQNEQIGIIDINVLLYNAKCSNYEELRQGNPFARLMAQVAITKLNLYKHKLEGSPQENLVTWIKSNYKLNATSVTTDELEKAINIINLTNEKRIKTHYLVGYANRLNQQPSCQNILNDHSKAKEPDITEQHKSNKSALIWAGVVLTLSAGLAMLAVEHFVTLTQFWQLFSLIAGFSMLGVSAVLTLVNIIIIRNDYEIPEKISKTSASSVTPRKIEAVDSIKNPNTSYYENQNCVNPYMLTNNHSSAPRSLNAK